MGKILASIIVVAMLLVALMATMIMVATNSYLMPVAHAAQESDAVVNPIRIEVPEIIHTPTPKVMCEGEVSEISGIATVECFDELAFWLEEIGGTHFNLYLTQDIEFPRSINVLSGTQYNIISTNTIMLRSSGRHQLFTGDASGIHFGDGIFAARIM